MVEESQEQCRRLQLPVEILQDPGAVELIDVWFSQNRVVAMTCRGTEFDRNPTIWGQILAGVANNLALSIEGVHGIPARETLKAIKESLDRSWPSAG